MGNKNKAVNSGVNGSAGHEFQKYCAIYLILDRYNDIKDKKYFVCIEHHDDFLFCYMNEEGLVYTVNAYQAKKNSGSWGLTKEMTEIIQKITQVGIDLNSDNIPKDKDYSHNLKFITNAQIKFSVRKDNDKSHVLVNEANSEMKYLEMDEIMCNEIKEKLIECLSIDDCSTYINQLDNFSLFYIDLPKRSKEQKEALMGKSNNLFGDKVSDHKAAIDTLLELFRDVENTLNQGNEAKLLDKSKRVDCTEIEKAINIITKNSMAFNYWRENKRDIRNKIQLPFNKERDFKLEFTNSFDRFKDLTQTEHQKILEFVKSSDTSNIINPEDSVDELYNEYIKLNSTQLSDISIKAAIFAAIFEKEF